MAGVWGGQGRLLWQRDDGLARRRAVVGDGSNWLRSWPLQLAILAQQSMHYLAKAVREL